MDYLRTRVCVWLETERTTAKDWGLVMKEGWMEEEEDG